jgi:hypothetical protein
MKVKPEQPEHIKNAIMAGNAERQAEAEAARRARPSPVNFATPPPGKAPIRSLDEWEALPQGEQLSRMDEVDVLLRQGAR